MEEKKISSLYEEIKDDFSKYVTNRLKLFKLESYAKISQAASFLIYIFAIISLVVFVASFILITLALYLGEVLGIISLGFAIVTALLIFLVIVIMLARKSIKRKLRNVIISLLMDDDDKD